MIVCSAELAEILKKRFPKEIKALHNEYLAKLGLMGKKEPPDLNLEERGIFKAQENKCNPKPKTEIEEAP